MDEASRSVAKSPTSLRKNRQSVEAKHNDASSRYVGESGEQLVLEWFASYLGEDNAETKAKFFSALQLRDAYEQLSKVGQSIPEDRRQWVNAMHTLFEDIKDFCLRGYAEFETSDGSGGHAAEAEELVRRFKDLDETRIQLNEFDDMVELSAAESRRMAVLEGIAQMGTDDEQALHNLIVRYDQCQIEVNGVHKTIALLVSPGGVPRETMEELYLYLKEKVNADGELTDALSEEMHDRVYSLVEPSKCHDVVKAILDIHVLEDEQIMLKQNIDSFMNSPSSKERSGNISPELKEVQVTTSLDEHMSAEAKDSTSSDLRDKVQTEFTQEEINDAWMDYVDQNGNKYRYNQITGVSEWAENAGVNKKISGEEVYTETLKSKHQNSLKSLKNSLEASKAKRLRSLEDRLMRRQQLRKKNGETDSGEDKELEKEIYEVGREMDELATTILSGYKKKCLYEMKVEPIVSCSQLICVLPEPSSLYF